MAETSFPIMNQPLSDQQWGQVTRGIGNGILAAGGFPYALSTRDNAANTITLSISSEVGYAQAIVSGFYHRIDAPAVLSIPAVTATTNFYIGLVYDPTQHSSAGGPVKLSVSTSIPSGGGKVYLPLHEIWRSPNQLLTDAAWYDARSFISPQIAYKSKGFRPDPKTMLIGAVATDLSTGARWRVNESRVWEAAGDSIQVLPSSTSISGPPFTMGTASKIQAGRVTVTTDANGDASIFYNVPFPNGVLSVVLTPFGISTGGSRFLVVMEGNTTLSQIEFRSYGMSGALSNFTHTVNYVAMGW